MNLFDRFVFIPFIMLFTCVNFSFSQNIILASGNELLRLDVDLWICATKAIKTSCNASCASLWEHSYSYLLHFFSSSRPAIPSLVPQPGKLRQRLSRFATLLPLFKVRFRPAKTTPCMFRVAPQRSIVRTMMTGIHFGIGLPVPPPARSDFLFTRMP